MRKANYAANVRRIMPLPINRSFRVEDISAGHTSNDCGSP
jgi:hypothetical protein